MESTEDPRDACDSLAELTDEAWLKAHRELIASGSIPVEEGAYLFDPDRDPAIVDPGELSLARDPKEPRDRRG